VSVVDPGAWATEFDRADATNTEHNKPTTDNEETPPHPELRL
jgi:hypothetical protein